MPDSPRAGFDREAPPDEAREDAKRALIEWIWNKKGVLDAKLSALLSDYEAAVIRGVLGDVELRDRNPDACVGWKVGAGDGTPGPAREAARLRLFRWAPFEFRGDFEKDLTAYEVTLAAPLAAPRPADYANCTCSIAEATPGETFTLIHRYDCPIHGPSAAPREPSARIIGLLEAIRDNDPDQDAADGVSCGMVWQREAEQILAALRAVPSVPAPPSEEPT